MVSASDVSPEVKTLVQEVRYRSWEAGEVILVWGIDGWNPLSESLRPLGTTLQNSVMNTPMIRQGDWFVVTIPVPAGSTIEFGFKITKSLGGADLNVWDGGGEHGYHAVARQDDTIEVISPVALSTSGRWNIQDESSSWKYMFLVISATLLIMAISGPVLAYRRRQRKQSEALSILSPPRVRKADVLLLSAGIIVAIGIGEYGLRLLAPHGGFGAARELDWMRSNPGKLSRLYAIDPQLGFRPNLTSGFYSEYGTRRNGYTIEKRPGVTRLLFMGDSVTFRGTIIDGLRRIYGEQVYEYWNAGVESYNTVQEVNFYQAYNHRLHPDHVILTFHPNDFETTPVAFFNELGKFIVYAPNRPLREISPFLFEHSYLYRLVIGLITSERTGEEAILNEIVQSLITLRDALRDGHIRLTVLVLPLMTPPDLWSVAEHERRTHILQVLKDLRIAHVDLLPPLTDAVHRNLALQDPPGDIWHPSAELSDIFAQYLHNQRLLE